MTSASTIMPVEIGRANQHDVKITWQDGHGSVYPARALRLACPCAGCVDEMTGRVRLLAAGIPDDVHPVAIQIVGRYAVNVRWSDGHDTGLYAFDRLRQQCPCTACAAGRR